jgi:hypothetical protein
MASGRTGIECNTSALINADDVNILGDNMNTINKNTEALIEGGKWVDPEVNADKTKCMVMSRHQNAEQSHNLLIANEAFENVSKFEGIWER